MLIHDKFYGKSDSNYAKFRNITGRLTKRQCVGFALYCAKNVFNLVEDRYKEVVKLCIDLVEKWLIDENSVTSKELKSAADAVYAADTYVNSASDTVAYASWAASASAAYADAAVQSAGWAADAANASWYATRAAASATHAYAKSNKLNEYLVIANSYFTKTNINCPNYEIEGKILYLIDELEENIIVHKDKYYVNMNGIENCPEYGFDTQQELLNELLYSEDQFWEFARNWLDRLYKNQQA